MARAQQIREVEPIDVDVIHVGDRLRAVSEQAVAMMVDSLGATGLLTPISVRIVEMMVIDGREVAGVPVLIAGATRLAAARRLGWPTIDTLTADIGEVEARKQEIAENLHRTELTVQERAEHVAEWVRLAGVSRQADAKPQGGRPESGVRAAARELGLNEPEARRAVQVASITPEAKEAARDAGLDDNQSALLKVAKAEPERQVAVVTEIAQAKALKVQQDIQNRAATEIAEMVVANLDADGIEAFRVNLAVTTTKAITAALANLVGESIMDRRHG